MPAIANARNTLNVNQTLRKPDIADAILLLQPDASPLTVLSKRLNKKPTHNPLFQWAEDDLDPRFSACPAGVASTGGTAVAVTAGQGSYFQPYDLVKVPATGEVFRVISISTDTLTVVRGVGNAGVGVNIPAAAELLLLGSAMPEGATSKPARSNNANMATNYTQIFRKPVESTETWIHSDQFTTQNDWDYQLAKEGIEHLKDIEESFLQGRAMEDTTAFPGITRSTGGVIPFITTNVTAAGGVLSEASFFAALRPMFRYGSGTKTGFAAGLVVDVLNTYARSKVQIPDPNRDTYGLQVVKYQSPHGTLNLVRHWLLEGGTYGGYLVVVDMSNVQYRYLANEKGSRDTHVRENIQAPDADTQKNEYLTECGLQFGLQATHGLITGITG